MKKTTAIALLGILILGITSCKKDWTCKCAEKNTGKPQETLYYKKLTKKDAKVACKAADGLAAKVANGYCVLE
ncbi:MAG: hypothetical protein H6550_12645 [Chitinophagales bacterium]|nr:hypothetical protein [Chitinophagales bacterium]